VIHHPSWSPDGSRIAFDSNRNGNYDVWIVDVGGPISVESLSWGKIKGAYRSGSSASRSPGR
jgi:dipeptidyl aminopeptidase/acylaminoacyl peptidase